MQVLWDILEQMVLEADIEVNIESKSNISTYFLSSWGHIILLI
jgi:hypothetical protein